MVVTRFAELANLAHTYFTKVGEGVADEGSEKEGNGENDHTGKIKNDGSYSGYENCSGRERFQVMREEQMSQFM